MGRRARDRVRRLGQRPAAGPQHGRLHAPLPGGARARPRARLAPDGARRRGGGVRRVRPAELRAAPVADAPRLRLGGPAACEGHAGDLRDLRPALARGALDDGAPVRRPARAAGAAGARGPELADARLPRRRRRGAARGDEAAGARGDRREAARLALRARPPRLGLDQGEERLPPGVRDRRLDAGRGRPLGPARRARGRRQRRRPAGLLRQGRHRLHRGDAGGAPPRARAAADRPQPVRRPPAAEGNDLRRAAARRGRSSSASGPAPEPCARPRSRACGRTSTPPRSCASRKPAVSRKGKSSLPGTF